ELRERKFIFITAAILATIPFLGALLPFSRRFGMAASIVGSGGILAAVFTIAVAIGLGSSMVARDLSERRLSFYFARPVSAGALWFGKLAGAVVTAALCFAIILVPALLAAGSAWSVTWPFDLTALIGAVLLAGMFLLLVSHALNTMIRSRSALLVIDLILIAAFVFATGALLLPLVESMALQLFRSVAAAIAAMVLVALIAAGTWQLSRGRADLRRSHAEMSKFLWIAVGAGLLLIGGYVAWVFTAEPDDLDIAFADQSARGDWAAIGGFSEGRGDYFPVFLLNPQSGESIRFPAGRWSEPSFTRAGNAAFAEVAPIRWRGPAPGAVVTLYRFGIDEHPITTDIPRHGSVFLSDDARRMAVVSDRTVSIHEIDTQRLVASAAMTRSSQTRGFFVTPDLLRILATEKGVLKILELDATTRKLTETGSWTGSTPRIQVQANDDGSMLLVTTFGEDAAPPVLLDGRTGAVRATLGVEKGNIFRTRFLRDGRVAALTEEPGRALRLFAPDGTLLSEVPISSAMRARIEGETATGKLVLALSSVPYGGDGSARRWDAAVVDLERGTISRREPSMQMVRSWWGVDPRVPVPNATGEFLIKDAAGTLWRWNAESGEKKELI
ncbi:MAG TPA: ABC transporter permease, partial [Thermoanaerobaculia bacterium]|nr:ABC transporter permease [Thermoanaerobaculia bacterium]